MKSLTRFGTNCLVLMTLCLIVNTQQSFAAKKAEGILKNIQTGNPKIKRIGKISFGPSGLLVVADPNNAAVVVIDTQDLGPVQKLKVTVKQIDLLVAGSMGAKPESIEIASMAVTPLSGKIYLSIYRKTDKQSAILMIDANGKISNLNLDKVKYVRVSLPDGEKSKVRNITGVAFTEDRILAAGQCREEFANKIYSIPLPLTHGSSANIFSAETYHVAHRRWETKAPIQSFVPLVEDGKPYIVGAFACTPIAKFPLSDLKSGNKVKGISVVELGSGNRPLDMITYESGGKEWLVTNTFRFHWKKNMYGPSKWWGVRVDMDYLNAKEINEKAVRRNVKKPKGPDGIEIVDILAGAVHIDKLGGKEIVVLRDNKDHLDLEIATLP